MFTWLRKRCRRNSAPSEVSNKRLKVSNDIEENSYEEVSDFPNTPCEAGLLAYDVTNLTNAILTDYRSDLCPICMKSFSPGYDEDLKINLCACYLEPIASVNDVGACRKTYVNGGFYDTAYERYSSDHIYSSIPRKKRRKLYRSRSDIRKRPLPEVPIELQKSIPQNLNKSESDTIYENIDSDSEYEFPILIGPYVSPEVLV